MRRWEGTSGVHSVSAYIGAAYLYAKWERNCLFAVVAMDPSGGCHPTVVLNVEAVKTICEGTLGESGE